MCHPIADQPHTDLAGEQYGVGLGPYEPCALCGATVLSEEMDEHEDADGLVKLYCANCSAEMEGKWASRDQAAD